MAVNRASQSCEAGGYFGAAIYDQSGHLLSDTADRAAKTLDGIPVNPVTVAPGGTAFFTLKVQEVPVNGATTCPRIGEFRFIPPNGTVAIRVPMAPGANPTFCGSVDIFPTTAAPDGQTTAPTPSTGNPILVYGDCQTPSLEPDEIVLTCADYSESLEGLRWSSWSATEATATGTFVYNDCRPSCAGGHDHDVPNTKVTLTAPVRGAGGQLVWSKLQQDPEPPGYSSGPFHGGPFPLPTRAV